MIIEFKDEFSFLSNFHPCTVVIGLMKFPSSEHAFMSFKNNSDEWKKECQRFDLTPGQIKRKGRKIELVSFWEDIKIDSMRQALWFKFTQNKELKEKLLDTGNQNLVEGNNFNDVFWGVCLKSNPNVGENHLGRLLMEVRSLLK
jgi:ribA/ribD-fused uncharacterized protein